MPPGRLRSFDIAGATRYAGRVRLFICLAAVLWAGGLPAMADTNLLTAGQWAIDGATDPATNAAAISVTVGKGAPVAFSELKFYYRLDGVNPVQVFSITGRGVLRPSLPPPNEAGGSFQLGSYQDCEQGLVGPLAVTDLGLPAKIKNAGPLLLTGTLANGTSLRSRTFTLKFFPPQANLVRVDVRGRLVATRNFCVNQTTKAEQDKFRVVTLTANFVSATDYDNDLLRFIRTTERTCAGLWGCYVRHQSDCVNLLEQPPGYLITTPRALGTPWLLLAHTTTTPRATPCLQVAIHSPSGLRPQGWRGESTVEFWGNWMRVRKSYKAGQSVAGLSCSLEAIPPRPINCDWVQPQP